MAFNSIMWIFALLFIAKIMNEDNHVAVAFVGVPTRRGIASHRNPVIDSSLHAASSQTPIFDFADPSAITKFDRIDDAIMGGISTSVLRENTSKGYATWSGVCRTDGGGFCGFRTLPFLEPLNVTNASGLYVDCRLVSDDKPERRVWKMSVRTEAGFRGEQLYQAEFAMSRRPEDDNEYNRVCVPFKDFQLVRGPRLVPDGPAIDVSGGIYQVGFSMSKFQIAANTAELENFRDGYFDLQIQQIGMYCDEKESRALDAPLVEGIINVETESKESTLRKRPVLLKVLGPVLKFFFSEKASRRKRAMKLLKEERGLSRIQAMIMGAKMRSKNPVQSFSQLIAILFNDIARFLFFNTLKVCVVYPIAFLRRSILFLSAAISGKKMEVNPQRE